LTYSSSYLIPLAAAGVSYAIVVAILRLGMAALPLDHPNERSLHDRPVPRGGGIAIVTGTAVAFALIGSDVWILASAAGLAVVSYLDDRAHLNAALRFAAHLLAAVILVARIEVAPLPLAVLLTLGTIWMINLYNFMDGSDGLAGGMAVVGFSAYAMAAAFAADESLMLANASIAAASAAFLVFNFPPARIFLGDVGSVPLGFLAAALGIVGWRANAWPLWFPVLVFSPFVVDASVTLLRRVWRGERVWQAHKTHYYQRLVQLGWGHKRTALAEYLLMIACALAALVASDASLLVQATTLAAVALLYGVLAIAVDHAWMQRAGRTA
jgi:UDP-N-acetylmuramyl pentapeptide phosphotransferase/UDP-N-acetylglucosamine-1-phosphate transferase